MAAAGATPAVGRNGGGGGIIPAAGVTPAAGRNGGGGGEGRGVGDYWGIIATFAGGMCAFTEVSSPSSPTVLVTGASGFIGSFVAAAAVARGYETYVAVRSSSSRRYLSDARLHFLVVDFSSAERCAEVLGRQQFDYVVHAAGATKAKTADEYFSANVTSTEHLVAALLSTQRHLRKFVFLSSLSVMGALHEDDGKPFVLSDIPCPNTLYGQSKYAAEQFLLSVADRLNVTILRPTGVYGPRERDYFLMMKSIARHVDIAVGCRRQVLSFVYVSDVVAAIFCALQQTASGKVYFLSDGGEYDSAMFSQYVVAALGQKHVVHLTFPLCVVRPVCAVAEMWSKVSGTMTALNRDKYHILSQRNWRCDISATCAELGFTPRVLLAEGVARTVAWYKKEGWL